MAAARDYIDSLAKPIGALGELETIVIHLAGIFGRIPANIDRRRMLVFCADNGVHAQGISPVPQSVTRVQGINIAKGLTGMGRLAERANAAIEAYDVGINAPAETCAPLINKKVMPGTHDFTTGPAMSRDEAVQAIEIGRAAAIKAASEGISIIGV